mgnify:CR=1 FL=1
MIECNMQGCQNCMWEDSKGCIEVLDEEEAVDNQSASDVSDEEWAELFAEYEEELGNEIQFNKYNIEKKKYYIGIRPEHFDIDDHSE